MVQFDSLILAFLVEALTALSLILLYILWRQGKRRREECQAVEDLISRIRKVETLQSQELEQILGKIRPFPDKGGGTFPEELGRREKALYRQVLKLFLERNPQLLPPLEEHIRAMGKAYQHLLGEISATLQSEDPETARETRAELETARAENRRLREDARQLAEQLRAALETIDRLSSEYTRMFAPGQEGGEPDAERQKILEVLRRHEHHLQPAETMDGKGEDIVILRQEESL